MKKAGVLILLFFVLVGCNQRNTDLENAIHSVVKDKGKSEIKIQSHIDFDWEKAFLFTPYSTAEVIEEQLQTKFNDKSNIHYRDDIYLLVFLYEDKVVQYAGIERQGCDFSTGKKSYLTPANDIINIESH